MGWQSVEECNCALYTKLCFENFIQENCDVARCCWFVNDDASRRECLPVYPTNAPTDKPSEKPSTSPTTIPTAMPSQIPTAQPSVRPSTLPSTDPSSTPSSSPSVSPSAFPTNRRQLLQVNPLQMFQVPLHHQTHLHCRLPSHLANRACFLRYLHQLLLVILPQLLLVILPQLHQAHYRHQNHLHYHPRFLRVAQAHLLQSYHVLTNGFTNYRGKCTLISSLPTILGH